MHIHLSTAPVTHHNELICINEKLLICMSDNPDTGPERRHVTMGDERRAGHVPYGRVLVMIFI